MLGELRGATGLRSRLATPGTTVQELESDRELARVLEPWTLWGEGQSVLRLKPDDARRWERRFLD